MPFRKLLIRIMLWSLGATAVAGALAMLIVGMGEFGWKIVGTGLATAVAATLMVPFSIMADKPKWRVNGLLGMALIVIEFIGTLALIWGIFGALGYYITEEVALTMLFLGLTGLPALGLAMLTSKPIARIAARTGIVLCAVVFVLLMIGVRYIHDWTIADDWMGTAGVTAGFAAAAVGSLVGIGTQPRRVWRWGGIAAAVLGCTIAIYAIWMDIESESGVFAAIVSIAAVVPHANLCLLVPLTSAQRWVRVVTIAAAVVTAAAIDLLIVADNHNFHVPMGENLAGAAGIIACCGSLALLVLARINRNLDRVPVLSEIKQLTIICPGCQKRQTMSVGQSTCGTCGLKFDIRLEEPRCPTCDYLLFMLQSDRCPECGTIVRAATVNRGGQT